MWCVPGGIRRGKREKGKEEGGGEVSKMEEVGEMFKTGLPFLLPPFPPFPFRSSSSKSGTLPSPRFSGDCPAAAAAR